jgi:hypothetical protein
MIRPYGCMDCGGWAPPGIPTPTTRRSSPAPAAGDSSDAIDMKDIG